jgi:predicted LPLAT superfamily acyltransferase
MSAPATPSTPRPAWAEKVERGSMAALRLMRGLVRRLGRRRLRWILHPIAAYYLLTDGRARRASRRYLERLYRSPGGREVLGHPPGLRDAYRHLYEFATSIFDRMCVWGGIDDDFVFEHEGAEHFAHLPDAEGAGANSLGKRGAIILGAHLGTFDMMRSICNDADVPLAAVMYGGNAEQINSFFETLAPDFDLHLIHVAPGGRGAALEIRGAVERGAFVAILADRVGPAGSGGHAVELLGATARLPRGPFELAALIGCPVMLATARRVGDARYRVESEPLYSGGRVPRRERDKVVEELIERYAGYLERGCLRAPYQWFNFFEFWEEDAER